jgi:murein DD-endopeptidase MepM/ murein hydrolase activator NlpD
MADQPSNFQCEPERDCLAADLAKVQPDSDLKNTLIFRRRLRIRVLDCRSGEPLVGQEVEEVRLNGEPLAKFLAEDRHWDISEHLPISGSGSQRKFGKQSVTLLKASQIALNALGYECGVPGNTYGPQGKTAFLKFRVVAKAVVFKSEELLKMELFDRPVLSEEFRPAAGKKMLRKVKDAEGKEVEFRGPTDSEVGELIRIYNTKCYRGAQFHLASLDFYPENAPEAGDGKLDALEAGKWTEGWKSAYHRWQQVSFGRQAAKCDDWIVRKDDGTALMEQKRGFITDENGDVFVPIPVSLLKQENRVEVGFKNFAVVAEATLKEYQEGGENLHRHLGEGSTPKKPVLLPSRPTRFAVEWVAPGGGQENTWDKPWGWRCGNRPSTSSSQRNAFKEFRTSWKFTLPAFTQAELDDPKLGPNWSVLHQRKSSGGVLSLFYDGGPTTPEFVLFALVWCQPVWDEFKDPGPRGTKHAVNANAFVCAGTPEEYTNVHMHVVTQYYDLAGNDPYGGMGYGLSEFANLPGNKTRWRGGHGHPGGIDLHHPIGAEAFAVHSGKLGYNGNSSGFGHLAYITWAGVQGAQNSVYYGHVRELVGAAGRPVKAGEVIARGGREGWLFPNSDQAGHVHLLVNGIAQSADAPNLFMTPDEANRVCIPFTALDGEHWLSSSTPLLLPCKCEVTYGAAELAACRFSDAKVKPKPTGAAAGSVALQISQFCWAAGHLACPHMPKPAAGDGAALKAPGANAVKRRVQAQFRWLMNHGLLKPEGWSNLKTASALKLDGDLGTYPKEATIKVANANLREAASATAKALGQAPKDTKLPLLDVDGDWYHVTLPPQIAQSSGQTRGWVNRVAVTADPVGDSRKAIRAFRAEQDLLPEEPTLEKVFELDDAVLAKLNEVAMLVEAQP